MQPWMLGAGLTAAIAGSATPSADPASSISVPTGPPALSVSEAIADGQGTGTSCQLWQTGLR